MHEISLAPEPTSPATPRAAWLFPAALTALFALMTAVGLARHELWRDEAQAWLIATASATPWELLQHMRYEGHPALWQLLLWVVSRLSADPIAMQAVHGLIAVAAAAVVAFKAPFGRLQKIGLLFGYYMVYEYAIISRSYALGMLLFWTALALYQPSKPRWGWLGLCLLLLTQTSAYGAILALALAATLVLTHWRKGEGPSAQPWRGFAALWLPLAAGLVAFALQVRPPADYATPLQLGSAMTPAWLHLADVVQRLWFGYVPVPNFFQPNFWNSNVFAASPKVTVFALLLFGFFAARWRNRRPALTFYLLSSIGLLVFTYFIYLGLNRHFGHLFLALVGTAWLAAKFPAGAPPEGKEDSWIETRLVPFAERNGERALLALLALQLVAGLGAWLKDITTPFSLAKETAAYVQTQLRSDRFVAGVKDAPCSAIAAYLQQPLYDPVAGRPYTYVVWDKARLAGHDSPFAPLVEKMRRENKDCVLVLNFELALRQDGRVTRLAGQRIDQDDFYLTELQRFNGGVIFDENYCVYLLERKNGEAGR